MRGYEYHSCFTCKLFVSANGHMQMYCIYWSYSVLNPGTSWKNHVNAHVLLLFVCERLGLLQGKVCCCLWVIHMDSHPFLVPFVCMHFYMQSISGCLSYCGKTKIQTDQSNSSYVYWNIIEYGEFDWSVRFFVFLWWDKQPEIDCTLMHKTTPIHCSHTCPQYRIEHLLWPLHYGLSSRLQYLTPDATHCTNP